jgi:tRNA(Arg) A34 adenosine deaminase TadA
MDLHLAEALVSRLLDVTESSIVPLTRSKVSLGCKVFGAAILTKSNLEPVTVATNDERTSPLLHGEINCIQAYAGTPKESRPDAKDCIFFATHEPCSLCLSGITWSGFNEIVYLFTYEDSRDLFAIPYDIDILQSVFQVASPVDTPETLAAKPLYNRTNKFFRARSVAEIVYSIENDIERMKWGAEVLRIKALYSGLSDVYQEGKATGQESSSYFR